MKRLLQCAAATMAVGALLGTVILPASAQVGSEYTHQDYNSIAARALRQQIMNQAILRQGTRSHRGSAKHGHMSKKHTKKSGLKK